METLEKIDNAVITLSDNFEVAEIYEQVFPAVVNLLVRREVRRVVLNELEPAPKF